MDFKLEKIVLWTDSEVCLHWLRSKKNLAVFVQNRVDEIRQDEEIQTRHVPTKDNPADLLSRGLTYQKWTESSLWWNGPQWLQKTENEWPEDRIPEVTPETEELMKAEYWASEIKAVMMTAVPEWSQFPWERFSSVDFATRVQARALRFIVRVRKESPNEGALFKSIRANMELCGSITAREMTAARQSLVYIEQQNQYPGAFLAKKRKIQKGSSEICKQGSIRKVFW